MPRTASQLYLDGIPTAPGAPARRKPQRGGRRLIAFGWYGGKFSHLPWLLPLLPECHHYCEPFGGSAAVLLNREPSPVETYNDMDGEVVNFFRVVREQTAQLVKAIANARFRKEYIFRSACKEYEKATDLARAVRFFLRARQATSATPLKPSLGRLGINVTSLLGSNSSVASRNSGGVELLPGITERLLRVQLENRPALDCIRLYEDKGTLFYCDLPPCRRDSGEANMTYGGEMTDEDHLQLAGLLSSIKGQVIVSGYRCDVLERLYRGWERHIAPGANRNSVGSCASRLARFAIWKRP
jgi:DNA adenine methylase